MNIDTIGIECHKGDGDMGHVNYTFLTWSFNETAIFIIVCVIVFAVVLGSVLRLIPQRTKKPPKPKVEKVKPSTSLEQCIKNKQLYLIPKKIKEGAKVNEVTKAGNTPLRYAIFLGYTEAVKVLLEEKADVNIDHKKKEAKSILDGCIIYGRTEILPLLIEKGVDVKGSNAPIPPLIRIMQVLFSEQAVKGIEIPKDKLEEFYRERPQNISPIYLDQGFVGENINLFYYNDKKDVEELQKNYKKHWGGDTAEKLVRLLLDAQADPNTQISVSYFNPSVLILAIIANCKASIIEMLLERGAQTNYHIPYKGFTPLIAAIQMKRLDIVKLLLNAKHKANPNLDHYYNKTLPLFYAIKVARMGEIVKELLNAGAIYEDGYLDLARKIGDLDVIQVLVDHVNKQKEAEINESGNKRKDEDSAEKS